MVIIIIMPMMQVPLGVIFKNENKLDEMVDIMDHLNQYIPTEVTHTTVQIPGRAPKRMQIDTMHKVLIGGDQLTVARMKGAKSMREDSQHDAGRLDGFIPVVEDWHTKVCLLEVRLFHVAMMILSVSSTPCMLPLILFLFSSSGHVDTPIPERCISGFWNTATATKPHQSFKCSSEAEEQCKCS